MDEGTADPDPIASLLSEAGLTSYDRGPGIRTVLFSGSLRPWAVDVRPSNGWICLRAQVMTLPEAPAATRVALLKAIAETNDRVSLAKLALVWGNQIVIDAQYLASHVDAHTLARLVWLIESIAEHEYPRLLDIARAGEALEALGAAFKRSPAA